jgi:murein DD-endopeptidase MepM/ murein hydrolase activator NlpD
MVLAKKGEDYKVVHGGYEGMKDYTQHGSEERRKRFWDRMGGKNSSKAKDPFSPLYWHKRFGTWQLGGTTYDMPFLQKENLLNQSKFSKFARGGMTAIQAYNFLFEDDDDDMYGGNNAPDINEVNKLKDENKNLAASLEAQNELNERLTGQLRRSGYNAAAMNEVNRPFVYNEGSTNYGMITDNPEFWNTENENFVRESFNNDFGSLFAPGTNAPITSNFGLRNISSNIGSKDHNGIDIGVAYGTDIYSPVSGVVTNVWKQGRGGLQVSVTSPTGERLGFAHLSGTPLKIGAQIQKGQLIGKSGTGGTGPHLHFTLTDKNGFKVDPVKYFNTKTWNMRDYVPEFKSSKK